MNDEKTRQLAKDILEKAFNEIQDLELDYNLICSTAFFDEDGEVADESRLYCNSGNITGRHEFKIHAECLLKEIKQSGEVMELRYLEHLDDDIGYVDIDNLDRDFGNIETD